MKSKSSIVLVLLLVILPAISYWFLLNGSQFFHKQYSELDPKSSLPQEFLQIRSSDNYVLPNHSKDSIAQVFFNVAFPGPDSMNTKVLFEALDQFAISFLKDRNGIRAPLTFTVLSGPGSPIYKSTDNQCEVHRVSENIMRKLGVSLGVLAKDSEPRNFILLVDKVGRIRNIYLDFSKDTFKRLYRHLSILVPPAPRKDIIHKRQEEL